ncbi:unnamed protein product [Choristocarpus tenellus]
MPWTHATPRLLTLCLLPSTTIARTNLAFAPSKSWLLSPGLRSSCRSGLCSYSWLRNSSQGIQTMAGDDDLPLRYRYSWPRPAVTVDCLIYTLEANEPMILLIKRKNDPCKGCWALPGGFVEENEGLEDAASRELEEETGISDSSMVQTGAYANYDIPSEILQWLLPYIQQSQRSLDAENNFRIRQQHTIAFSHIDLDTNTGLEYIVHIHACVHVNWRSCTYSHPTTPMSNIICPGNGNISSCVIPKKTLKLIILCL